MKQCIESVIKQTCPDFEALCVDDCGKDNSIKIVEKYAKYDDRIKILKHEKNRGLSAARNTALAAATGKYIVCLDSDDWLEENALEYLKNEFEKQKVECILFDGYKYNESLGARVGDKICRNSTGMVEITPRNIVDITDYSWIKAYSRKSIVDNNIDWPEGLTFEDGEFHMKYFSVVKNIYVTSACLINYRIREGSIVTVARAGFGNIEHIYQVVRNVRTFYIERGIYDEYKIALLKLLTLRVNTCRKVKNNYEKSLPLSKKIIRDFGFPEEFDNYKERKNPIVSVIVPVYNVEKYIKQCINSIQVQTFGNIEIICVNDCTQDNSMKIVKELAKNDSRIKIISHIKNKGLGAARNTGLNAAKGKYCLFVDSDDWINPKCIETVYKYFEKYNLNTIWFKANIWWEKTSQLTKMWIFQYFSDFPEGKVVLTDENFVDFPLYSWNKAYNREFLLKKNIRWTEGVLFEDVEFFFKLFTQSPEIYIIDEPLYVYRRRDDSIIGNCCTNPDKAEHLLNVTTNVYKYLVTNDLFEKYQNAFYRYSLDALNMFRAYPKTQRALFPRMQKFIRDIEIKAV